MGIFAFVRIPPAVARLLLLDYAVPGRTDIGFGLASIILSVVVLAGPNSVEGQSDGSAQPSRPSELSKLSRLSRLSRLLPVPAVASISFALLILVTGVMLSLVAGAFPPVSAVMLVALVSGLVTHWLLTGKRRIFCYLVGGGVIATAAFFNPLSTNLGFLYNSELAQKITELNTSRVVRPAPSESGVPASAGSLVHQDRGPELGVPASAASLVYRERPLWLCYGLAYPEVQVQILGGRALPGIQWPPQLELWRRLDPSGAYEGVYNRYAHVQLAVEGKGGLATFTSPKDDTMVVTVAPTNPALAAMGARYVLAMYRYQENIDRLGLPVIYKSQTGSFTIYGIPSQ
jgi:hypothetical protein